MNREERIKQLKQQIEELAKQIRPLQEELNEMYKSQSDDTEAKIERVRRMKDAFTLDELRFAARNRCDCGAGLAYPKKIGVWGSWDCSDILLGRAIPKDQEGSKTHVSPLPFQFYEIKSEDQPSANVETTRPQN